MKTLTKVAVVSSLVLSSFAALAAFSPNMGADALRAEVQSRMSSESLLSVAVAAKAANVPEDGLLAAMLAQTPAPTLEAVLQALREAGYEQIEILKAAKDLNLDFQQAALGGGFSPELVAEATAAGGDAPGAGGFGGATPGFGAPSNFGNTVGGGGGTTPVSPS
jgi:hypothetical protein